MDSTKQEPAELAAELEGRQLQGNEAFKRFWNSPQIKAIREKKKKENGLRKWFEQAVK